jgi:hypothetical protein
MSWIETVGVVFMIGLATVGPIALLIVSLWPGKRDAFYDKKGKPIRFI